MSGRRTGSRQTESRTHRRVPSAPSPLTAPLSAETDLQEPELYLPEPDVFLLMRIGSGQTARGVLKHICLYLLGSEPEQKSSFHLFCFLEVQRNRVRTNSEHTRTKRTDDESRSEKRIWRFWMWKRVQNVQPLQNRLLLKKKNILTPGPTVSHQSSNPNLRRTQQNRILKKMRRTRSSFKSVALKRRRLTKTRLRQVPEGPEQNRSRVRKQNAVPENETSLSCSTARRPPPRLPTVSTAELCDPLALR